MVHLRIADTFTDSLARLNGDEQKAVKTTAFDLQVNPSQPGLSFHKLDRAKDKRFWSVRVNDDIRIIVHKTASDLLLCYVGHHDSAYHWAERRKLETHPKTGAAQLVEIRETIREIVVPAYIEQSAESATQLPLFGGQSDEDLLSYGVPAEWLADVRTATEDTLLTLADHLPAEAAEALLELATGGNPRARQRIATTASPYEHPDALRRFRVMANVDELERALAFPWDKWTVFLHPEQREWVEQHYSGPARVAGSAGTGKTIVALHRAVFLARANPDSRVLLTTFSDTLANALRTRLRRLVSSEPRLGERLEVHSMNGIGERLYERHLGKPRFAANEEIRRLLNEASVDSDQRLSPSFLWAEWEEVIDAWQLDSWQSYRDVKRLGRKTRLPESRRAALWSVFERARTKLRTGGLVTHAEMFNRLAAHLSKMKQPPFDFVVVDEAQDVSVQQLRFLATLWASCPDALFLAGDLGQRIFQQPFSWKSLGVDIRGRSRTLHVNYRTSHQIRMQADRLLPPVVSDVDGNTEDRRGTVSVFNGPAPVIQAFETLDEEVIAVGEWLTARISDGIAPHEIGLFVRSEAQFDRARAALKKAAIEYKQLDERVETTGNQASLATMHIAKGLEFRAVVVMACDDEIVPLQERISSVADDSDLEEVYNTERHLLYVACTRARDCLLMTSVAPQSEFLDDLQNGGASG